MSGSYCSGKDLYRNPISKAILKQILSNSDTVPDGMNRGLWGTG